MNYRIALVCVALNGTLNAAEITATDVQGKPMATVMVSHYLAEKPALDLSDDGYPPHGVQNQAAVEHTLFSIAAGVAEFADLKQPICVPAIRPTPGRQL